MENIIKTAINSYVVKIDDAISKMISKYTDVEDLAALLSDESNLYKDDGSLTDIYEERIRRIEESLQGNNSNDFLISENDNPDVRSAKELVLELMRERERVFREYDYEAASDDFEIEEWIEQRVGKDGLEQIKRFLGEQIEKTINNE